MMSNKVKVAVRVRPINRREIDLKTKVVVNMKDNQVILKSFNDRSDGRQRAKVFAFDHCFCSMDRKDTNFADQEKVFDCVGSDILERSFEGYNGCIFAYGQTGSGKSYTMMGSHLQKGIIPRLCDRLFERIAQLSDDELFCKVEVSYMEIYNEKVYDLLDPKSGHQALKVREHNILGPYVDGLSLLAVTSFEDVNSLMSEGNKSRTVAATNMNSESSRSHAVFNVVFTQTLLDKATGVSGEKVSKLSLVDLAGTERGQKSGAAGERLREGSNINKSLTTLGLVISALADEASSHGRKSSKFVPYRDSVLTWILKDNLGGNSLTVMVATVSPSADNYEETMSTLRYADRAKRIVNHAVINEDPNVRIICDLREEVETLRQQLSMAQSVQGCELQERLMESEKLMKELCMTWEEKLAEAERVHTERHRALKQMGVSVQSSGIRLENSRHYLVNLNADPSLNELLVYYLEGHALVGRSDAPQHQDIQLSGLGIMPEHAVVDISDSDVYITPLPGARMCVNGMTIEGRRRVRHGDRIVWGNNHFFRLNCPRLISSPHSSSDGDVVRQKFDFDFAQQELMEKELSDGLVQEAIGVIEKQHEEEKQEALDKQRLMYEQQMQMLRNQLASPGATTTSFLPQPNNAQRLLSPDSGTNAISRKYQQWTQDREKSFTQSLANLREGVTKANALVREANFISQEMGHQTRFTVTLQIPAGNLSPNRRRGAFVSEPAISVRHMSGNSTVWTVEDLQNGIIDMRDVYEERRRIQEGVSKSCAPETGNAFCESQENHSLIGVANIFLECLFHDVELKYHVPVISQHGEVAGKLRVEVFKLGGAILDRYLDVSDEDNGHDNVGRLPSAETHLRIMLRIRDVRGLHSRLGHFVFCQYHFWGASESSVVVPPDFDPDHVSDEAGSGSFVFNHEKVFDVPITEEFLEFCADGALSVEVWGHVSDGLGRPFTGMLGTERTVACSIIERWSDVVSKIGMWVEVLEVNEHGNYTPVEVVAQPDVLSAGVFQLQQGHSRRLCIRLRPLAICGSLPLMLHSVTAVSIGCLTRRSRLEKGLDSYQEEDLCGLRELWCRALSRRRLCLDELIQKLINKPDKTGSDHDREQVLVDQLVCLTEERNAVLVPTPGTIIPGAPADWSPPPNMEKHIPVIFLDLNADDMSVPDGSVGLHVAGGNSLLPEEDCEDFAQIPIIKAFSDFDSVCAVASWDSSLHDLASLNRVTAVGDRLYMVVKVTVLLSHPASMELVLRKRIAIQIYRKQSLTFLTHKLRNKICDSGRSTNSGVTYELISNLPKAFQELDTFNTLAPMFADGNDCAVVDGETYIEKYVKGIFAVDSILTLDRLRQEVAVKELVKKSGRPVCLRKTTSSPNMSQTPLFKCSDVSNSEGGQIYLIFVVASPIFNLQHKFRYDSIQDLSAIDQISTPPSLPGRPSFLNLPSNLWTLTSSGATSASTDKLTSPLSTGCGRVVMPMTTLIEEHHRHDQYSADDDDGDDEGQTSPHDAKQPWSVAVGASRQDIGMARLDHCPESTGRRERKLTEDGLYGVYDTVTRLNGREPNTGPRRGVCPRSDVSQTLGCSVKDQARCTPPLCHESISPISLHSDDSISAEMTFADPLGIPCCTSGRLMSSKEDSFLDRLPSGDGDTLLDGELRGGDCSGLPSSDVKAVTVIDFSHGSGQSFASGGLRRMLFSPTEKSIDSSCPSVSSTESENVRSTVVSPVDPENDVYSMAAMEQLELLCRDDDSDDALWRNGNDTSSSVGSVKMSPGVCSDFQRSSGVPSSSGSAAPTSMALDISSGKSFPPNRSTPSKEILRTPRRKVSAGVRPRPMSMVTSHRSEVNSPVCRDYLNTCGGLLMCDGWSANDDSVSECSFGSRPDLDRLADASVPSWVTVGKSVVVLTSNSALGKSGTVRFVGHVRFAAGHWVGVELDRPDGRNDGMVRGVRYFDGRSRHGVFVRPDRIAVDKKGRTPHRGSNPAHLPTCAGASLSGSLCNLMPSSGFPADVTSSPLSPRIYMKSTSSRYAKRK